MKRGAKQLGIWIEGEKNPWLDVYEPEKIIKLASLAGINNEKSTLKLAGLLGNTAQNFLELKIVVNLDQTRTNKKKWLENNIVQPAAKLLDGLSIGNNRFFSEKYHSVDLEYLDSRDSLLIHREADFAPVGRSNELKIVETSSEPDHEHGSLRVRLIKDLKDLMRWAERKKQIFNKPGKKKHRTRYREELVFVLMKIYIYFNPTASISPQYSGRRPKGSSSSNNSQMAEFVRSAACQILDHYENLDDQMKLAARRLKKMRKNGPFLGNVFSIELD